MKLELHLRLISDTTFGRGDGVAGLVDEEVEHDAATGLPFLRGRTLKGLLVEECANILYALDRQPSLVSGEFQESAKFLFGQAGSTLDDDAMMHIGTAVLPGELRDAVRADVERKTLAPTDVLESLTSIRRQTAVDQTTGTPDEGSLRSMRILLRETALVAPLAFHEDPNQDALALLAACVLSLRRGGIGRNRGLGHLSARLCDEQGNDITPTHFRRFHQLVKGAGQ